MFIRTGYNRYRPINTVEILFSLIVIAGCITIIGAVLVAIVRPELAQTQIEVVEYDPDGTYVSDDGTMAAIVHNGAVQIDLVNPDSGNRSLYWLGDFPELVVHDQSYVSDGDEAAMDRSLTGSLASIKTFEVDGDVLRFEFTVMGVTGDVELVRK